jgi:hypothetical protein
MVVVARSKKKLIPCWLNSSDFWASEAAINFDAATSLFRTSGGNSLRVSAHLMDKNPVSFHTFVGGSFQYLRLYLNAGATFLGCDQIAVKGNWPSDRAPIRVTLNGDTTTAGNVFFNAHHALVNKVSGSDHFTIPLDREWPAIKFNMNTDSGGSSNAIFREIMPMGGTRYYRRIWRNAAETAFFEDEYGKRPLAIAQHQIVTNERVLPSLAHTLTQVDELNWKATINQPMGAAKTLQREFRVPTAAFTIAEIDSIFTSFPTLTGFTRGTYWIALSNGDIFLSEVQQGGWINVASSFANGSAGAITPSNVVLAGTNTIVTSAIAASLGAKVVQIRAPSVAVPFTVTATEPGVVNRFTTYRNLNWSAGDQKWWTLDPVTAATSLRTPNDTSDTAITNNIWAGNGAAESLHWTTPIGATTRYTSGVRTQLNLWVKVW